MKIERVKDENIVKFADLSEGDAFARIPNHSASNIYIKTYNFECEGILDDVEDNLYNAIKLSDGEPAYIALFEKVIIPNCKIVVE